MNLKRVKPIWAVSAMAVLMAWPAIYNGFPLLYPDSMSYLEAGPLVVRGLFHHVFPLQYSVRGVLYCLAIWPLHWNITAWPVVAANACLTALVLWLLVRALVPRRSTEAYLAVGIGLCLFTGLGWYVGFVMPDILGPVLYICFFLLSFMPQTLSRIERWTIVLIAWWSITAHASHLLLAGGLCLVIPVLLGLQHRGARRSLGAAALLCTITGLAALAQMGMHARLYGQASLNGKRPPFLLARVIADGPGRTYLQQYCRKNPAPDLYMCRFVDKLPDNAADFLWAPEGIRSSATAEQRDELRKEELPLVLGTLRTYPMEELRISAGHFWRQLNAFGLFNYSPNPWIREMFATIMPGARANYLKSRQVRESLHVAFFTRLQKWTVGISLVVLAMTLLVGRRMWTRELAGLLGVITFVIVANAAVTGILSNVEDRYQGRVIWMIPLLAGLAVAAWLRRGDGHPVAGSPVPPTVREHPGSETPSGYQRSRQLPQTNPEPKAVNPTRSPG